MQGGSSKSLRAVLEKTGEVLAGGADGSELGGDLFTLAVTLDHAHSLRRALTEPAVPGEAKARLLRSLFSGKIGDPAIDVAEAAVGLRWSSTRDFPDALEQASVSAHVAKADDEGHLDDVEDNLFRFGRIAEGSPGLREALNDSAASWEGKRQLVEDLIGEKVDSSTRRAARAGGSRAAPRPHRGARGLPACRRRPARQHDRHRMGGIAAERGAPGPADRGAVRAARPADPPQRRR